MNQTDEKSCLSLCFSCYSFIEKNWGVYSFTTWLLIMRCISSDLSLLIFWLPWLTRPQSTITTTASWHWIPSGYNPFSSCLSSWCNNIFYFCRLRIDKDDDDDDDDDDDEGVIRLGMSSCDVGDDGGEKKKKRYEVQLWKMWKGWMRDEEASQMNDSWLSQEWIFFNSFPSWSWPSSSDSG